ncbi:MAG: oligosaccharide flippase family protein [Chloroflexi bacterium]|nr:oligosaccharide flippase family protein [Chloroflexota bacterium]
MAVLLGVGLAAVQLIPFVELAQRNFRVGSATYAEVAGYALPARHVLALVMPDVFGNPTHHRYFDLFDLVVRPVGESMLGRPTDPPQTVFWGIKNYVEGAGYVGVVALVFAALALARPTRSTGIFAGLAIWSCLLAFGAPLYRVFFFLPFFDQLHTPFRWLFPASFALAALAGLGADRLSRVRPRPRPPFLIAAPAAGEGDHPHPANGPDGPLVPLPEGEGRGEGGPPLPVGEGRGEGVPLAFESRLHAGIAWACLGAGGVLVIALGITHFWPRPVLAVAAALLQREERLRAVFSGPAMLASYEAGSVFLLALGLLGVGAIIALARSGMRPLVWQTLGAALVFVELYAIGAGFLTRVDSAIVHYVPPAVRFLQQRQAVEGPFRVAGFGGPDALRPNTAMLAGLEDVRGYDSMFPRQFVEYWSLIEPPDALLYNQIANLRRAASLASPLLDLLNVRYIVTAERLDEPGLRPVYDGELRIYERPSALPRAFFVGGAQPVPDVTASRRAITAPGFDPRRTVVVEGPATGPQTGGFAEVEIAQRWADRMQLHVHAPSAGHVVVLESYFPGLTARVNGADAPVYRADANFRAVPVPAGDSVVEVRYNPDSFKLGLFASFLAAIVVALVGAYPLWRRLFTSGGESALARVGRNSFFPMSTSLLNKLIDFSFAMLVLRMLGPENNGKYVFAGIFIGYFEIFTNFGLNTLLIREVARDRAAGSRFLGTSLALRLGLWLAGLPVAFAILQVWRALFGLDDETALAIALLGVALVPGNVAAAFSSLYYARERLEVPAAVTVLTTLLRVSLGAIALLAGWGFVGLAIVAVLGNVVTMLALIGAARRFVGQPKPVVEVGMLPSMLGSSYPLMLNHLLATLFFKIDVLLLKAMQGDAALGYYGTAYKLIDGLLIIPSSFTFAVFPLLSRLAADRSDAMRRAYVTSLRLLLVVALPIAVVVTQFATPFIDFLGGAQYLPQSALTLQILIWFLPFSFVNGLTQYVLIAVNQQRFITGSFVVATAFNVVTNLLLIPPYGIYGAAVTTVLSEVVLLTPFMWAIWRYVGAPDLWSLVVRPIGAAGVMAGALLALSPTSMVVGAVVGVAVYTIAVVALRVLPDDELTLARQAIGRRFRRRTSPPCPPPRRGEGGGGPPPLPGWERE